MRPLWLAASWLLLIECLPCPGLDVGLAAAGSAGLAVVDDERFAAGLQEMLALSFVAEITGEGGFGAGIALATGSAWPSAVHDLVSYRGTVGPRIALFAVWHDPRAGKPASFAARAGLSASYLRYFETEVWFVSPGLIVEPLLVLSFPRAKWLSLRFGAPLVVERRADLTFAASIGIAMEAGARIALREAAGE